MMFQVYHLKKIQKIELNSRALKSIFKTLIEVITMLYSKSIDFASKLASNNKKIKKKKISSIDNVIISFSDQWAIDEFLIIKTINQLNKNIHSFQNFLTFKAIVDQNSNSSIENIFKTSSSHTSTENSSFSASNFLSKQFLEISEIDFFWNNSLRLNFDRNRFQKSIRSWNW